MQLGLQKQLHTLTESLYFSLTKIFQDVVENFLSRLHTIYIYKGYKTHKNIYTYTCKYLYVYQFMFHIYNQKPVSLMVISKPKQTEGKC